MDDLFIFATRYIKFYSPLLLPPLLLPPPTPPLVVVTRAGRSQA